MNGTTGRLLLSTVELNTLIWLAQLLPNRKRRSACTNAIGCYFIPKRELWIEQLEEQLLCWRKISEIACFLAFTRRFDPQVLHLLRLHACLRCNFSYATLEKLAICLYRPKLGSDYDLVSITKSDRTHRKHNFRNSKPYQTINCISGMEAKANFDTLYC